MVYCPVNEKFRLFIFYSAQQMESIASEVACKVVDHVSADIEIEHFYSKLVSTSIENIYDNSKNEALIET